VDCGVWIVDCRLQIADCGLWIVDCGIADCRLQIADCGLHRLSKLNTANNLVSEVRTDRSR
jgi:hypothetical protein